MIHGVFARRGNEQGALRRPLLRLVVLGSAPGYSSCGIMSLGLWKYFVGE